jgi:hypothetical protein
MENQKARPDEKSQWGKAMKGNDHKAQGRGGTAPLLGQRNRAALSISGARNTCDANRSIGAQRTGIPPLLEALLRRKRRNDLFKAWIAPQGIPPRHQF